VDFDPTRPSSTPRDAATVILLRARPDGEAEVFMLRRHRGASFMAQAFVFPGGARDGDEDLRATAARELFEEAGVLLADRAIAHERVLALRARVAADEPLAGVLGSEGVTLDLSKLTPFAHWITPSAEKKRFSARFFVAELPAGQTPRFDAKETVEELWVTPAEGLRRADELNLPPPQLRTLLEIRDAARRGPSAVIELARGRKVRPIVPRYAPMPELPGGFSLLLPWDSEYQTRGTGDGEAFEEDLKVGSKRFFREGTLWRQV
jgi:8-oxo-dGTP pyrophosphatase MutT (NUDIX family)